MNDLMKEKGGAAAAAHKQQRNDTTHLWLFVVKFLMTESSFSCGALLSVGSVTLRDLVLLHLTQHTDTQQTHRIQKAVGYSTRPARQAGCCLWARSLICPAAMTATGFPGIVAPFPWLRNILLTANHLSRA